MRGPDEWLSPARVQKPAYSPASANSKLSIAAFRQAAASRVPKGRLHMPNAGLNVIE